MSTITAAQPYVMRRGTGVTDLWWPYSPAAGRYTVKVSGEQTRGRLLQFLATEVRGAATPLHTHHDTDETFHVIEGSLTVFVGDARMEAGAGDFVFAPMGVPHAFAVTSERAEFLVTYSPAGTAGPEGHGVHGFFKEVSVPVVAGAEPPSPAVPDPQLFAERMRVYGIELVGPPPALD